MEENKVEKVIIKQDLIKAYEITFKGFRECINRMNEKWFSVIRLIITLSASILLVSISLIDKIFPLAKSPLFIRNFLVLGWILLFLSIIFGILTELKGAESYGKMARDYVPILKNYLRQMTKGQFGQQEIDLRESFIEYPSLFWGLSEVVTFIFGILYLSIYSIGNVYALSVWHVVGITILVIIAIGILIYMYFKKR